MTPRHCSSKMVEAGRLGEKVGKGFYGYGDETDEPMKQILADFPQGPEAASSASSAWSTP